MSKIIYFMFTEILLMSIFSSEINAQVVINEMSTATSKDWVELYAYEDTEISGWILDDKDTNSDMKVIDDNTFIGPSHEEHLVIEVGNRLNKNGDEVTLFNDQRNTIDQMAYGGDDNVCIPSEQGSVGRYPDANSATDRFKIATRGNTNNDAQLDPCPLPTPIPSNTPRPTTKPAKPTATTKPVATSINLKPTNNANVNIVETVESSESVLSESETFIGTPSSVSNNMLVESNLESHQSVPELSETNQDKNKPPLAAGFIVLGGLGFVSAGLIPVIKDKNLISKLLKSKNKNEG